MKKTFISLFLLFICAGIQAQSNLAGRVYHNANIMSSSMKELYNEVDKKMSDAKAEALQKAEEEKKRKLTDEEKEKVEKEVEEGRKIAQALLKGMKSSFTLTFKDQKVAVMKMDIKLDDEVMKAAGINWAKRKLLHAACAVSPTEKAKYTIKDDMVILDDGKKLDTLYLSDNGKTLSGMMEDHKTPFKLTLKK